MKTEEILITFILYRCVILKKYSRDTGIFWQVSFLYAPMDTKTDGGGMMTGVEVETAQNGKAYRKGVI